MECFVLGSGGMMPMPGRRLTSVAVRTAGAVYLLDCGEGTQVPYKERHLGQRALRVIAVTHLHADHCLGLPGLLMLRAQMPDPGPLTLLGPAGLERFVDHVRSDLDMYINYPVRVRQWHPDAGPVAYRDEHVAVEWAGPLDHRVVCLGYRLVEHQRPGRFDPAAAAALGVPRGPRWGTLQQGESVTLPDGTVVEPGQVLGPPRRGRVVAYVTDTAPTPQVASVLRDADLALVESMFLPTHAEEARDKKHMTVHQAAHLARQAGCHQVRLIHISPRYDHRDLDRFDQEAALHHPRARAAREGECIELPLPD